MCGSDVSGDVELRFWAVVWVCFVWGCGARLFCFWGYVVGLQCEAVVLVIRSVVCGVGF